MAEAGFSDSTPLRFVPAVPTRASRALPSPEAVQEYRKGEENRLICGKNQRKGGIITFSS